MRQGLGFVASGLAIGLALAFGAAKLASSQLYGRGEFDVITFVMGPNAWPVAQLNCDPVDRCALNENPVAGKTPADIDRGVP
jgi:hypothetical protein